MAFKENDVELVTWYFDYNDGSILIIDNLDYIYHLKVSFTYKQNTTEVEGMSIKFTASGWDSILMKHVVGFEEYRVFSNFNLYESNRGRVVVYHGGSSDDKIIKEWIGDVEERVGEYMWIGGDALFGDVIIAFTSRSSKDELHHINFYKVIRLSNGALEVFDYKLDAI